MKKFIYILTLLLFTTLLQAQSTKTESIISIRGSGINLIGELNEIWETGTAIYVSYENISSTKFSYMFQVGYIQYKENPNYQFSGSDPKFDIIPLQVGGRYYILTNWIRPFLMGMTGVNIVQSNYPLIHSEDGTFDETMFKLNFQVGLGLAVKLFSRLQLEILGNYNSHVLDAPTHYNITGYEFAVGLNWVIK